MFLPRKVVVDHFWSFHHHLWLAAVECTKGISAVPNPEFCSILFSTGPYATLITIVAEQLPISPK